MSFRAHPSPMKQTSKAVKRGRPKPGQPGIASYAKRVMNPIARKRSEQQVLEEEREFENGSWGDTDEDYNPADGDDDTAPAAGLSRARASRAGASKSTSAGRTRAKALYGGELEDPIELDETDVEDIQDDDDDMPLAVKKRRVARKDVSGPPTSMRLTRENQVAARSRGSTATNGGQPPWDQVTRKRLVDSEDEVGMDQSRKANASPAEQCFKVLSAVVKRVSCVSRLMAETAMMLPVREASLTARRKRRIIGRRRSTMRHYK